MRSIFKEQASKMIIDKKSASSMKLPQKRPSTLSGLKPSPSSTPKQFTVPEKKPKGTGTPSADKSPTFSIEEECKKPSTSSSKTRALNKNGNYY